MDLTEGTLLGGRVRYSQPAVGFRSGLEPVLLAASVPAKPGERVLESGTGAGAALLCLAARVPGVAGLGVEINESLAAVAKQNLAANGIVGIEVAAVPIEYALLPDGFDHAMANPPYHEAEGTASPLSAKETAKRAGDDLLHRWIWRLSVLLRPRGTLTLIVPSGRVPVCLAFMLEARCPCSVLAPLWPKAGRPAKLVLLRARKHIRSPMRLLPGLTLHNPDGTFTTEAQAILRDGGALTL